MGKKMIDKLKYLIDSFENNKVIKDMLLDIAKLPENKQEDMLQIIEIILGKLK